MNSYKMSFRHAAGTATIVLDESALLWFARSLNHEGSPLVWNAWTMLQRFVYMYPRFGSFEKFVRAFSQPVNPRWYPGGDLFEKTLAQTPHELRGPLVVRGERRLRIAREGWADISPHVRETLTKILANELPSPNPASIDFAAVSDPEGHARVRGLRLLDSGHGNAFFAPLGTDPSAVSRSIRFTEVNRFIVGGALAAIGAAIGFLV